EKVARTLNESPVATNRIEGLTMLASLSMTQGKLKLSQQQTVEESRLLHELGRHDDPILWEADKNIRLRGKPELGVQQIVAYLDSGSWRATPIAERPYWDVIDILSLGGRPDLGRELVEELRRERPDLFQSPDWQETVNWMLGSLAMAEGDYQEAARRYRAST